MGAIANIRREIAYYRLVLAHPRTPRASRWLLGAALAYLVSPIDLIPDGIPVIGLLDDLLIVPGLIFLAMKRIPPDVRRECRRATAG